MSIPLARLFTAGFAGTEPSAEILGLIRGGLGGVILFQRNIAAPLQLVRLVRALKSAAEPRRLVVSIDQEGGRVARLRGSPWASTPPMREIGRLPRREAVARARALGSLLGRELRHCGIDLDFAPVLDVDTNPDNPVIGDRSFSSDPAAVAALGVALAEGLQSAGVAACGKHFPGHGDTAVDSHLDLPRLGHHRQRLESVELVPFRAAARAGIAAMMMAHVVYERFDAERPATLSATLLDLLRGELGFPGVVVGDDLEMQAVAARWPIEIAAPLALAAGCDHLLVCSQTDRVGTAIAAVGAALEEGHLPSERIDAAIARWERLAQTYARPAPHDDAVRWLESPEHQAAIRTATGHS